MKRAAEVVIIGGGCMGASVAWHLARRGVTDVVILEREPFLAMGSTGRNAGGVRHQFSTEANIKLSIESIRLLENFREAVGHDIDFHQDGYLFLLSTEEGVAAFRRNVALQRRLGVVVEWLTPDEARRLAPGLRVDGVLGATFCARDGIADPNGVTMGFARAAQAAGVEIYRDTEVTGVRAEGGKAAGVETTHGSIATRAVVNAAGPWARQVGRLAGVEIPVLPYRRHIFITEPLAPPRAPASRLMVIDFATTFYFHREGAGVLFGMSDREEPAGFDTSVKWEFLEQVVPVAVRRLPALAEAGIAHAWAGLYEMTPDAMPIIGPAAEVEGFYLINGFSGHGFQHAPAAGRVLADMLLGRVDQTAYAEFAPDRFARHLTESEINVV